MWMDGKNRPGPWVPEIKETSEGLQLTIIASDGVIVASSHKFYSSKAEALVAYTLVRQSGLLNHNVIVAEKGYSATVGSKNHYLVSALITVSEEAFITGKQLVRLLKKNDALKI